VRLTITPSPYKGEMDITLCPLPAVLETKKGVVRLPRLPLKWAQKRQRYPYINRTPLPVTVLSDYREKGKTYPISNRAIITLFLSSTPARRFINSLRPASTIDCELAH